MASVQYYLGHIAAYEREFKKWEGRVEKIIKRYRDEMRGQRTDSARFNVLWSNVQTLKAATFARMPMPDVSRRFKDNDPVGRVAALILERALEFEVNHYKDYGASIRQCVYDRFLGGRGCAWVRYEPTFKQVQAGTPEDGYQATEDVDSESQTSEELDFEMAPVDYVHWKDFGHSVARTWEEVEIVWRKVYMTRQALEERFPESAKSIPLDSVPEEQQKIKMQSDTDGINKRALIYEIWDKNTGKALWLSKSLGKFVDEKDDPLQLEEFFPCPPPIYATLTTESLVPLPDFTMYQDQANELDLLSDRIDGLIKALQLKGVYDASVPELARLFTEGENGTLIPAKNWQAFTEKQGLKGALDVVDLQPIAMALKEAYVAFEQVKAQIYEITGISDILRGETAPSETATAQQIKNNYASMRLKVYQDEVERFASRLLQLKAQIICKHFDAETIAQISSADQLSDADKQLIPQALAMLKTDVMRSFRIEVATDSMVYQNEQQDKADRMEFLNATSAFIKQIVDASQAAPQLLPLGAELLKFGVTGFRVGKNLEGTIDQAVEQLKQMVAQQQANPQPNPEMVKAQAAQQATQMQEQNKAQMAQVQQQHEASLEQMRQQHEANLEAMRQQSAQASKEQELAYKAQCDQLQRDHEARMAAMTDDFNRWKTQMDNETKVLVAELSAQTSLKTAAMSASDETTDVSEDGSKKPTTALSQVVEAINENFAELIGKHVESNEKLIQAVTKPKTVVRGPDGKLVGVQ